jgi:hypothetical protein
MGNSAKGCYVDNPDALAKQANSSGRVRSGTVRKQPSSQDIVVVAAQSKTDNKINKFVKSKSRNEGDTSQSFDSCFYEMRFQHMMEKYHTAEYIAAKNKLDDFGKETRTINKTSINEKWPELGMLDCSIFNHLAKSYYGNKIWGAIEKSDPETVQTYEFLNSYPSFQSKEQYAKCKNPALNC